MKKIVFVLSILCLLAVVNIDAQIVVPGEKTTDSPKNIGDKVETQLSKAELRMAIKKANASPDIIVEKRGKETLFFRRSINLSTGKQQMARVAYVSKTGEFVEVVESPGDRGKIEKIRRSNPNQKSLGPERY